MEYAMVDATILKVHRHGQCAKGTQSQSVGRKGGMTTTILALTSAIRSVSFSCPVIASTPSACHADRWPLLRCPHRRQGLRQQRHHRRSQRARRQDRHLAASAPDQPLPLDAEIYKWRHLIENFFCKLKEFKRIAMRADKTDVSFNAIIHRAAAVINSR
jgi:hypothetical protein